jgi:hypothetical protein
VDPRAGLGAVEKREISCLCLESNRDSLVVQPVAYSLYRPSYLSYFIGVMGPFIEYSICSKLYTHLYPE